MKEVCKTIYIKGAGVRIWFRAYGVLNNKRSDSTYVRVDRTKPAMTSENSTDTKMEVNFLGGSFNYTTR